MLKDIGRREFSRASATQGAISISGDLSDERTPEAHGFIKIPEVEKITITIITDNYYDALRSDDKIAKRYAIPPGASILNTSLHAEHGLAYHVETVVNGESHPFLFDFGVDFLRIKRNMELLNIDFNKLEALGLSHNHFDHQAALVELLKSKKEEIHQGIPFYVGEQTFVGTYMRRRDGNITNLEALKREDIEGLGFVKIIEIKSPTPIVSGAYLTGKIEQVTEYEKVPAVFLIKKGDKFEQEYFIGEQAVVSDVKGKGLVVLSGCAHRGIVNAVKQAQRMTGVEKVHAVLGGFHLVGAQPEIIQSTIADIKVIAPEYVVPTHCTGFEAITALAREMPDQFIVNTAGTRYIFST
jgi:7,8-dihydropterin-6-yl-methyl-4-(beta-D-ribofuranosyl)aminobenzene 5'-phosphate synthase